MIISSHVGAGALIGTALRRPVPAFLAGFASHLAMDALPHWGVRKGGDWLPVARRDGLAGLAAMTLLAVTAPAGRTWAVAAGMAGACLPDTDKIGDHFFRLNPWPEPFNRFHAGIQREAPHRLRQEIITAGTLTAVAVILHRRHPNSVTTPN
jgi:hypothetical protein